MTDLSNSYKYTRVNSDGVYFTDLNISLKRSVKFDIVENHVLIATLITNNLKTCSLSNINSKLSIKSEWSWRNKGTYWILKDDTELLATIQVHLPVIFGWFRSSVYKIQFRDTNSTYFLAKRRRKDLKFPYADFQFDLTLNGQIKCSIINFKRPKCFYNPTTIGQEGIIEFDSNINLEQILCFLQLMNIYIDFEFDI